MAGLSWPRPDGRRPRTSAGNRMNKFSSGNSTGNRNSITGTATQPTAPREPQVNRPLSSQAAGLPSTFHNRQSLRIHDATLPASNSSYGPYAPPEPPDCSTLFPIIPPSGSCLPFSR